MKKNKRFFIKTEDRKKRILYFLKNTFMTVNE